MLDFDLKSLLPYCEGLITINILLCYLSLYSAFSSHLPRIISSFLLNFLFSLHSFCLHCYNYFCEINDYYYYYYTLFQYPWCLQNTRCTRTSKWEGYTTSEQVALTRHGKVWSHSLHDLRSSMKMWLCIYAHDKIIERLWKY